jgi:hypothetical protein
VYGYLASPQAFKLAGIKIAKDQQGTIYGVNNAGDFVGTYVASNGTEHGMLISGGKVKNIDDPKGVSTDCFDINSKNDIVGSYFDSAGNPHGFQYAAGKFKDIPVPLARSPVKRPESTTRETSLGSSRIHPETTTGSYSKGAHTHNWTCPVR